MQKLARATALLAVLLCATAPLAAATANEFYLSLLRRGISDFDAGRTDAAATSLRLAAFGLVDSIPEYETAYVYLTLVHDRLGHRDEAHEAAHRVVAADRVEHRFPSLALPTAVRASFQDVATKLLSAADLSMLARPAATTTTTTSVPEARTTPVTPPPVAPPTTKQQDVVVDKIDVETVKKPDAKTEAPKPAQQQPKTEAPKSAPQQQPKADAPKPTPQQPKVEAPKPAPVKPAPPKPAPVQTPTQTPAQTQPKTQTTVDIPSRLAAANRALTAADLMEARRIYRELLEVRALSRETQLRIGEGLYRSRDFTGALLAFERLGALRAGEEPYHYYMAVANYETGNYAAAKRELDAALPYIEVTPDVARYRVKIEGSID